MCSVVIKRPSEISYNIMIVEAMMAIIRLNNSMIISRNMRQMIVLLLILETSLMDPIIKAKSGKRMKFNNIVMIPLYRNSLSKHKPFKIQSEVRIDPKT